MTVRPPGGTAPADYSLAKVLIIIDDRDQALRRQFGLLHLSRVALRMLVPGIRAE